jgi:hypothetical protein
MNLPRQYSYNTGWRILAVMFGSGLAWIFSVVFIGNRLPGYKVLVVMRLKCSFICVVGLCLFVLVQNATAASPNGACDLPPGLRNEISQKYPHMHVVSLADLNEDDKELFQKDHDGRCPGLVKVDFYGDGKPTWALALTAVEGSKTTSRLLVARQLSTVWETALLETTDGPRQWFGSRFRASIVMFTAKKRFEQLIRS